MHFDKKITFKWQQKIDNTTAPTHHFHLFCHAENGETAELETYKCKHFISLFHARHPGRL